MLTQDIGMNGLWADSKMTGEGYSETLTVQVSARANDLVEWEVRLTPDLGQLCEDIHRVGHNDDDQVGVLDWK